jgi:hypothetical protein
MPLPIGYAFGEFKPSFDNLTIVDFYALGPKCVSFVLNENDTLKTLSKVSGMSLMQIINKDKNTLNCGKILYKKCCLMKKNLCQFLKNGLKNL